MPPVKKVGGNARIVIKSLIDSNVIANWLIFHSLLAQKQTTKEKNDFIEQQRTNSNKYIKTFYQSYEFVEHFVCRENKGFEFYYSPLVMTEVLSVLFEKYILRYMDRNFIPIEEFYRLRKEKFPEGTYLDIYLKNEEYFNKLKKHAKIARESK